MDKFRGELASAGQHLAAASDPHAKAVLQGVVMALNWAIEDGASPSEIAGKMVSSPLDHDGDGKAGGSRKGKLATARKRK